jgi:hypothetical protein
MTARRRGRATAQLALLAILGGAPLLAACAHSAITETGGLTSYEGMTPVKTTRTHALYKADPPALAKATSVRIAPVTYAPGTGRKVSADQRAFIANIVARTLCDKLSDHYDIAAADGPADLTVRAVITRMTPTNRDAARASVPLRIAAAVVGVPVPGRLPIGLGSFAAEGEAIDSSGTQRAAITWARGADAFTNRARVSKIGDAFELSSAFAGDLADLVITGQNPLHDIPRHIMSKRNRPIPAACDVYGRSQGVKDFLGGFVGMSPEVTDKQSPPPQQQTPPPPT